MGNTSPEMGPEVTGASPPAGRQARRRASRTRSNWAPIIGFMLISSANQMLWLNFAPITTGSAQRLGVSSSTVGLLSEIFPLIYVLLALPAGLALDRWFRSTLAIGAILTAGGAAVRLGGHGFAPVFIGQFIIAVGQPAVLNAVTGVASRSLVEKDRPTGIALGSAGTFLGFVLAFVFGLTLGSGRLHTVLVISAAYSIAGATVLVATLHWVTPSPAATALATRSGDAGASTAGSSDLRRLWAAQSAALRAVWSDPVMRSVNALVFLGFGVFVSLTTWTQTLLQPADVDARNADRLLVAMVVAGIVTSVALPSVVAARRAQPAALAVAVVGSAVACLLLAVAPGVTTGYVALALFGLVLLPALPILLELIEQRAGQRASTATGLLWLSGNAGGLVVALLVQGLVHHPAPAWVLMAIVTLVGVPITRRLRSRLQGEAAPGVWHR
jgi:predicted MFS family arabinose efflux permease